jgi:hypothetical protein
MHNNTRLCEGVEDVLHVLGDVLVDLGLVGARLMLPLVLAHLHLFDVDRRQGTRVRNRPPLILKRLRRGEDKET